MLEASTVGPFKKGFPRGLVQELWDEFPLFAILVRSWGLNLGLLFCRACLASAGQVASRNRYVKTQPERGFFSWCWQDLQFQNTSALTYIAKPLFKGSRYCNIHLDASCLELVLPTEIQKGPSYDLNPKMREPEDEGPVFIAI